jgi:hypothetical protein
MRHLPSTKRPTDHQTAHDQSSTDQQHPHASAGHYDEIKRIEELRRTQQSRVRDQFQADQGATRPASLPYLRRASHRR